MWEQRDRDTHVHNEQLVPRYASSYPYGRFKQQKIVSDKHTTGLHTHSYHFEDHVYVVEIRGETDGQEQRRRVPRLDAIIHDAQIVSTPPFSAMQATC